MRALLLLSAVLLFVTTSFAQPAPLTVPEPLKPWVAWVKESDPERECARVSPGDRVCLWPTALSLVIRADGGTFDYRAQLDKFGEIPLPGGAELLPQAVQATRDGRAVDLPIVIRGDGSVALAGPGRYRLTGKFRWREMPRSLAIPESLAFLDIVVNGKRIEYPSVGERGELWLIDRVEGVKEEANALHAQLFRRITDGSPFRVQTRLELEVSGRSREVVIGNVWPDSSQPISVESSLEYRFASEGLIVQAQPGAHVVTVTSVFSAPPEQIQPTTLPFEEAPTEEFWVWEPNESLRSVSVEGATIIDPSRTAIPPEWRSLTTYVLPRGGVLRFRETRRGERESAPNSLNVQRDLWLDLDGAGFSSRDRVTGTIAQGWRLDVLPGYHLAQVSVDGEPQLITHNPSGRSPGVELRKQAVDISAEARINDIDAPFHATGWDHTLQALSINLHLPPGWRLLSAEGVDSVRGTWLESWSLFDLFVMLLVGVGTWKLFGAVWGLVALCAIGAVHGETGQLRVTWFHLLGCVALLRALPEGAMRRFVRLYFGATLVVAGAVAAAFSISQIQSGMFPEAGSRFFESLGIMAGFYSLIESNVFVWAFFVLLMWGVVVVFSGTMRRGIAVITFFVVGIALLAVIGKVSEGGGTRYVSREQVKVAGAAAPQSMPAARNSALSKTLYESDQMYDGSDKVAPPAAIDPHAVVQTGVGMPQWSWETYQLAFRGSVSKNHTIRLNLLSADENLVLCGVRVLAIVLLFLPFIRTLQQGITLALLFCSFLYVSPAAAQGFPSKELLSELSNRVSAFDCVENCASITQLKVTVGDETLSMQATLSSSGTNSVLLPGPLSEVMPTRVFLDGRDASVRRDESGFLSVRVPEGTHSLQFESRHRRRDLLTLQFPVEPFFVEVNAPGWTVDGIGPGGRVKGSLQIARELLGETSKPQAPAELNIPPWFIVERDIVLGLPWRVSTRIVRDGGSDRADLVRVKLLPGESVTTPGVRVEGGEAVVQLGRGEASATWTSTLEQAAAVEFSAMDKGPFSEVWRLSCATLWRCAPSGIAPISTIETGTHRYEWRPYPGDSVMVNVSRPKGAKGRSITVDSVNHVVTPGSRLITGVLTLKVRSSQGLHLPVEFPEGVMIQKVLLNQTDETSRHQGRSLSLPIRPGENRFEVRYEVPWDPSSRISAPQIVLDQPSSNVTTAIAVPPDRWLLTAHGPEWGPVVLFWSKVFFVCIAALLLARSGLTPLSLSAWLLLGLGLATQPVEAMGIVVAWFMALRFREQYPFTNKAAFNLYQIFVVLLTIAAVSVLFSAVHSGLVLNPEMVVVGNGSTNQMLRWYVDFSGEHLPSPWMIGVPMWVWRVAMLLWSSWLVFALIRWLRSAFSAFSSGGVWRGRDATGASA